MMELTSHLDLVIFPGIFPLISARNADFIHNEVPGITVPKTVRDQLWRFDNVNDQRKVAMEITAQLIEDISSVVDGIYLVSPLNKWEIASQFVKQIRDAGWKGSGKVSRMEQT